VLAAAASAFFFNENPDDQSWKSITMSKGGRREGAGRPVGRRNNSTIAKEKATQDAISKVTQHLTQEEIDALTPLGVMLLAMRAAVTAKDWHAALSAAEKAAPYLHGKKAADAPVAPGLPPELQADGSRDPYGDPLPRGDEPGPENPVL
jgi:hypothetical protein